jgi:hypothetical protein
MISDFPPESAGRCAGDDTKIFFSVLCGIMVVATALAFYMALRTKKVKLDRRFSDSNAVILAIGSQLQGWVVGLPILVAVKDESSVEAKYLGRVLLIWLFSIVAVLIMVAPKVWNTWQGIRNPALLRHNTRRITVSGLQLENQASAAHLSCRSHPLNHKPNQASSTRTTLLHELSIPNSLSGNAIMGAVRESAPSTSERLSV